MKHLAALLMVASGCVSAPVESLQLGVEGEVPWSSARVIIRVSPVPSGYEARIQFWIPGLQAIHLVEPFEGASLILEDGSTVESLAPLPEILSCSGGTCNAWTERITLSFEVEPGVKPVALVLRCGLSLKSLECRIKS